MEQNKTQEYIFAFSPEINGSGRAFSGTAYGGGVITDHCMFDRVIFDLSTTKAPDKMAVLLEHHNDEIVGCTSKVAIGREIKVSGKIFDQDPGKKVAAMADEGFPWQMSVRIYPSLVKFIDDKESAEVNGTVHSGPLHILCDSLIREVSFCAVGADRETAVNVFNLKEKLMPETNTLVSGAGMGLADKDLAIKAVVDEKNQFKAELEETKNKFNALLSDNAELKSQLKSVEFENKSLTDSLSIARKEAEEFRAKYEDLSRSSRKALLEADYKQLGMEFKAEDESIKELLKAPEAAFQALRTALNNLSPASAPPEGAFSSVTKTTDFNAAGPQKSLADLAAERARKEASNGRN